MAGGAAAAADSAAVARRARAKTYLVMFGIMQFVEVTTLANLTSKGRAGPKHQRRLLFTPSWPVRIELRVHSCARSYPAVTGESRRQSAPALTRLLSIL